MEHQMHLVARWDASSEQASKWGHTKLIDEILLSHGYQPDERAPVRLAHHNPHWDS
jgi:hypothetical protein